MLDNTAMLSHVISLGAIAVIVRAMEASAMAAIFFRPFIMVVFMLLVVIPIKWVLYHIIPDSRIKRRLFRPIRP